VTARIWLAGALAATTVVVACADLEPDVGPPLAGTCNDADTNPRANISFTAEIRPLLARCGCHLPSASGPGTGTQLAGLDLSSLASLRAGGNTSEARIVVDGAPCDSILVQKLSDAPPFGSRMPLGGPFLTPGERQLIHDWIAEGARDN